MPTTNFLTKSQVIKLVIAILSLVVIWGFYSNRSVTYPLIAPTGVHFTNPGVLRDRAPDTTNRTILDHLKYFLATQNVPGKSLTISDTPHYDYGGNLVFSFNTDSNATSREVTVDTATFGPDTTSITVAVDAQEATYAPATNLYDATFTNFDTLTRSGLSGVQAYEVQELLLNHLPARSYILDGNTVTINSVSGLTYTNFSFISNGKTYRAQNVSAGITDVSVTVHDSSGATIFKSSQNISN